LPSGNCHHNPRAEIVKTSNVTEMSVMLLVFASGVSGQNKPGESVFTFDRLVKLGHGVIE
jgi:hypothetical protein